MLRTLPDNKIVKIERKREIIQSERNPETSDGISYGKYNYAHTISFKGLSISFENNEGVRHFRREIADSIFTANVATTKDGYYLEPVEPMNIPAHVTDFLQIKFEDIVVEPETTTTIYLTMPLGIGIFLEAENGEMNLLDMVGFNKPKFSLYGQPKRGVITRVHTSKVYTKPPAPRNYKEAILHLDIDNKTEKWVKIGRVIMYMKGLELYYDSTVVASCAEMIVTSPDKAYVNCLDSSLFDGLTKCAGIFKHGKISKFCSISNAVQDKMFTMDMGLR
ncbi:MAG TPA: DUF432 domain-containing protein [Methanocorpusculum sp.]|nr:DUF432 domain-containing protein [Methanocorpusculum sp.]